VVEATSRTTIRAMRRILWSIPFRSRDDLQLS
jgi:hypothetical protein